jgi:transcriptional regulator with XRE-family HTH domain
MTQKLQGILRQLGSAPQTGRSLNEVRGHEKKKGQPAWYVFILEQCESAKLSKTQMLEKAGLSRNILASIKWRSNTPSHKILTKIAEALGLDGDKRNQLFSFQASKPNLENGQYSVGLLIKEKREKLGLSLEDVAKEIGCHSDFLKDFEEGRGILPRKMFAALAVKLKFGGDNMARLVAAYNLVNPPPTMILSGVSSLGNKAKGEAVR